MFDSMTENLKHLAIDFQHVRKHDHREYVRNSANPSVEKVVSVQKSCAEDTLSRDHVCKSAGGRTFLGYHATLSGVSQTISHGSILRDAISE